MGLGLGLEQVCLGPAGSVWAFDFMWERIHHTSPGDFEIMFIKTGGSETKEELKVEEATGERRRKRGTWRQVQEVYSPGCKSCGLP